MSDILTKDDLKQFGLLLINDICKILKKKTYMDKKYNTDPKWFKIHVTRKLMDYVTTSICLNASVIMVCKSVIHILSSLK